MAQSVPRRSRVAIIVTGLCLLPLIAYFAYCTWVKPISAYYADFDPEFPYVLNSLGMFNGTPYAYVDHPGTPLEIIGTILYALTYPWLRRSGESFILYHLQNPGLFLTLAHGFLLAASAACVWYVAGMRRRDAILLPAALGMLFFAIHPEGFATLITWSHNSFAFAFGTLYLVILFKALRGASGNLSTPQLIGFGLGAGLLATVTIYLTAWVFGAIAIVVIAYRVGGLTVSKALAAGFTIAAASLAGFFMGVSPVLAHMPYFFDWIGSLLSHRDRYLVGADNRPALVRLSANLVDLFQRAPVLFVTIAVLIVVAAVAFALWHRRIQRALVAWAFAAGTIGMIVTLTGFILDHPKLEFMLSAAAVVPVLAIALCDIFETENAIGPLHERIIAAVVLAGVAVSLGQAIGDQQAKADRVARVTAQTNAAIASYAQETGRQPSDLMVLWAYRSYSPCFALWFGNESTAKAFSRELRQLCYRQFELNIYGQNVVSGPGARPLDNYKWDVIVGCSDAFQIPLLRSLPAVETYPDTQLGCGSLTIAYNRR
jgi:hypothetical protein